MEIINIIVGAFSTLVGLAGGGVGIYFWRVNKELKKAEVDDKRIDNELKQADWEHERVIELTERLREVDGRLQEAYKQIGKTKEESTDLKYQNAKLKFEIEKLQWHKCVVNGCPHRIPPHDHSEAPTDKFDEQ